MASDFLGAVAGDSAEEVGGHGVNTDLKRLKRKTWYMYAVYLLAAMSAGSAPPFVAFARLWISTGLSYSTRSCESCDSSAEQCCHTTGVARLLT